VRDFRFSKNPTREKNRALVVSHKELFLVGNATRCEPLSRNFIGEKGRCEDGGRVNGQIKNLRQDDKSVLAQ